MLFHGSLLLLYSVLVLGDDPDLNALVEELWQADVNRAEPGKDWKVDLQGSIQGTRDGTDNAQGRFFSFVNEDFFTRPTYAALIATFDNYEAEVGKNEVDTAQKRNEYKNLVDTVYETRVMKIAHEFLVKRGLSPELADDFKMQVLELWFTLYGRKNSADSSAFEHVFSGETKMGGILGFHNWVRYYLEEKAGKVDYEGYHAAQARLFSIGFKWNRKNGKHFTSLLVGVSPEFEIALLTTSFLLSKQMYGHKKWLPLHVQAGPCHMSIQCHDMHGKYMGTCYVK